MNEEETRAGANPAGLRTPAGVLDLPALMEGQLAKGLALLDEAVEVAGNRLDNFPRDRNGALSAAARLLNANLRVAEVISRAEAKRNASLAPVKLDAKQKEFLATRPDYAEFIRHRNANEDRKREGRPPDEHASWLEWYYTQLPVWEAVEDGGRPPGN